MKKIDDLGSEDFAMAVAHGLSLRYVFAESICKASQRTRSQPNMWCCMYIHGDSRIPGRE